MNVNLTSVGSYNYYKASDVYGDLGLEAKRHMPEYRSSPVYFYVNDEQKFFLSVIKYGIEYKILSDDEMKKRKQEYTKEFARRFGIFHGV